MEVQDPEESIRFGRQGQHFLRLRVHWAWALVVPPLLCSLVYAIYKVKARITRQPFASRHHGNFPMAQMMHLDLSPAPAWQHDAKTLVHEAPMIMRVPVTQRLYRNLEEAEGKLIKVLSDASPNAALMHLLVEKSGLSVDGKGDPSVTALLESFEAYEPFPREYNNNTLVGSWRLEYTNALPVAVKDALTRHISDNLKDLSMVMSFTENASMRCKADIWLLDGGHISVNLHSMLAQVSRTPQFVMQDQDTNQLVEVSYANNGLLVLRRDVDENDLLYPKRWRSVWRRIEQPAKETWSVLTSYKKIKGSRRSSFWRFDLPLQEGWESAEAVKNMNQDYVTHPVSKSAQAGLMVKEHAVLSIGTEGLQRQIKLSDLPRKEAYNKMIENVFDDFCGNESDQQRGNLETHITEPVGSANDLSLLLALRKATIGGSLPGFSGLADSHRANMTEQDLKREAATLGIPRYELKNIDKLSDKELRKALYEDLIRSHQKGAPGGLSEACPEMTEAVLNLHAGTQAAPGQGSVFGRFCVRLPDWVTRMAYVLTSINPLLSVCVNKYTGVRGFRPVEVYKQYQQKNRPFVARQVYDTLFFFARLKPRLLFVVGACVRAVQLTTPIQYAFDPRIGVGAGLNVGALLTESQWPAPFFLGWAVSKPLWCSLGAAPPPKKKRKPVYVQV